MISEQDIIGYSMENEYLAGLLTLQETPRDIEDLLFGVPVKPVYDTELPFAVHEAFRNSILNNYKKVGIEPHEVLVGGSKRGADGKKKIISSQVAKSAIDNAAYGGDGDAWGLVLGAWYFDLCHPDPHGTDGMTTSSIQNITDVSPDRISMSMATWLPDFAYFDYLSKYNEMTWDGGGDKYNQRHYDLAYEYLK